MIRHNNRTRHGALRLPARVGFDAEEPVRVRRAGDVGFGLQVDAVVVPVEGVEGREVVQRVGSWDPGAVGVRVGVGELGGDVGGAVGVLGVEVDEGGCLCCYFFFL